MSCEIMVDSVTLEQVLRRAIWYSVNIIPQTLRTHLHL
jgi:hypothetical protein